MRDPLSSPAARTLERNTWFAELPAALKDDLLASATVRNVGAGEWIYGTGDAPRGVFALLSGAALVYVALPRGDDVLVNVAMPGTVFGHAARLGRGPRLATVLSARPGALLHLPEAALERVGRKHPELWAALTRLLYEQYGQLLNQFAWHLAQPARARLAGRLLQVADTERDPAVATLSQAQLAELVGVTRKTVNQVLSEFAQAGVVSTGHGWVRILDTEALGRLARGDGE